MLKVERTSAEGVEAAGQCTPSSRQRLRSGIQGAYNSGKHGNLREFVNSGKFRENSGNLKFTQGIYQMLLIVM